MLVRVAVIIGAAIAVALVLWVVLLAPRPSSVPVARATEVQHRAGFASAAPAAPPGRAPKHIETWASAGAGSEGRSSPLSTVREWLTFNERPRAVAECNAAGHPCMSVAYINMNTEYFGTCGGSDAVRYGALRQQGTLSESAWTHASESKTYENRLFGCTPRSPNAAMQINQYSQSGPGNALSYFNKHYSKRMRPAPDYYFDDDEFGINYFVAGNGAAAYEYANWRDMQQARVTFMAKVRNAGGVAPLTFFNGCNANPAIVTQVTYIKSRPNIIGCIAEAVISSKSVSNGCTNSCAAYAMDVCAEVSLARNSGIYVNGPDRDNTMIGRRQSTAFNWLCYVPHRVIQWEEEESDAPWLNVFPEQGIYPMEPVQSMALPSGCPDATILPTGPGNTGGGYEPCSTHGHNDLCVAFCSPNGDGVYRREFAKCFNRGLPIGPCAVIWNLTGSPVTIPISWLTERYGHEMAMSGSDGSGGTIDEGGTVSFTTRFNQAERSMAPRDALFLTR